MKYYCGDCGAEIDGYTPHLCKQMIEKAKRVQSATHSDECECWSCFAWKSGNST